MQGRSLSACQENRNGGTWPGAARRVAGIDIGYRGTATYCALYSDFDFIRKTLGSTRPGRGHTPRPTGVMCIYLEDPSGPSAHFPVTGPILSMVFCNESFYRHDAAYSGLGR